MSDGIIDDFIYDGVTRTINMYIMEYDGVLFMYKENLFALNRFQFALCCYCKNYTNILSDIFSV